MEDLRGHSASRAEVVIRPAEGDDVDLIVELWWQLVSEHQRIDPFYWGLAEESEARLRYRDLKARQLADPEQIHLAAEVRGRLAGYIHGSIVKRRDYYRAISCGRVDEVVVDVNFRRQGVGKALLAGLAEAFEERGLACAELTVDVENRVAQALYFAFGFQARELRLVKKI